MGVVVVRVERDIQAPARQLAVDIGHHAQERVGVVVAQCPVAFGRQLSRQLGPRERTIVAQRHVANEIGGPQGALDLPVGRDGVGEYGEGEVARGPRSVDPGLQPPEERADAKVGNESAGHVNFAAVVEIAAAGRGADRQPVRARQRDRFPGERQLRIEDCAVRRCRHVGNRTGRLQREGDVRVAGNSVHF